MEKLLDRPRAFEESKLRYILALEAQRKAQILVISNAQRKLVTEFQQKLKASAVIAERHAKWRTETKNAKYMLKERRKMSANCPKKTETNDTSKRGHELRREDQVKMKRRPKTTGALKQRYNRPPEEDILHGSQIDLHAIEKIPTFRNARTRNKNVARLTNTYVNEEMLSAIVDETKESFNVYDSAQSKEKLMLIDEKNEAGILKKPSLKNEKKYEKSVFATGSLQGMQIVGDKKICPKSSTGSDGERKVLSLRRNQPRMNSLTDTSSRKKPLQKSASLGQGYIFCKGEQSKADFLVEENEKECGDNQEILSYHPSACQCSKKHDLARSKSQPCICLKSSSQGMCNVGSQEGCSDNSSSNQVSRKMSYEMRYWIADIQKDVRKVCENSKGIRKNLDSRSLTRGKGDESSETNDSAETSSTALEKFENLFKTMHVSKDALKRPACQESHLRELVDTTSLYAKSAVSNSKLDFEQKWHQRDPRNKKLKPSVML